MPTNTRKLQTLTSQLSPPLLALSVNRVYQATPHMLPQPWPPRWLSGLPSQFIKCHQRMVGPNDKNPQKIDKKFLKLNGHNFSCLQHFDKFWIFMADFRQLKPLCGLGLPPGSLWHPPKDKGLFPTFGWTSKWVNWVYYVCIYVDWGPNVCSLDTS